METNDDIRVYPVVIEDDYEKCPDCGRTFKSQEEVDNCKMIASYMITYNLEHKTIRNIIAKCPNCNCKLLFKRTV